MPTEHTVYSYEFDELSDKAKGVARDWHRKDDLDYEWWGTTYEDAARIGLKIESFDLGRRYDLSAKFTKDPFEVAQIILTDHGDTCGTYKSAKAFLKDLNGSYEPTEDQVNVFLSNLRSDYCEILAREQDYLTSDEWVDENIRANGYEFTINGKRFPF
jgi:hypothetical protein